MYHIETEIAEQPNIISRLLQESAPAARKIAAAIRHFDPQFVLIAARGTSDNAGRFAQYLMGIYARLPVALAAPSIHTLYEATPRLSRALVIGISQSGQSEDVRRVIADARIQGALTVSITNDPESPIAQAAEFHLPLLAGEEISVAATKTYTAELTAVAMITAAMIDNAEFNEQLNHAPNYAADTLRFSEEIESWVERYRYMNWFASLGRSYNYCTAFEISLKIKELCYIPGVEYSEADFRHGPIALVQPGFPVLVVAPRGKTLENMADLIGKLNERKAECLVISNDQLVLKLGQKGMPIPDAPEWLTPLCAVIPGQTFAMRLALARGNSVDKPIGLTKVTVTV